MLHVDNNVENLKQKYLHFMYIQIIFIFFPGKEQG